MGLELTVDWKSPERPQMPRVRVELLFIPGAWVQGLGCSVQGERVLASRVVGSRSWPGTASPASIHNLEPLAPPKALKLTPPPPPTSDKKTALNHDRTTNRCTSQSHRPPPLGGKHPQRRPYRPCAASLLPALGICKPGPEVVPRVAGEGTPRLEVLQRLDRFSEGFLSVSLVRWLGRLGFLGLLGLYWFKIPDLGEGVRG